MKFIISAYVYIDVKIYNLPLGIFLFFSQIQSSDAIPHTVTMETHTSTKYDRILAAIRFLGLKPSTDSISETRN